MNTSLKISEIVKPYYIYYFENNKPKLLKKDTEAQMLSSLSRLKDKGLAYFAINLLTFETFSSGYTEQENVNNNYALIVKTKEEIYFYTIMDRPFYDEVVYLSAGDYVMINRKEEEFVKCVRK